MTRELPPFTFPQCFGCRHLDDASHASTGLRCAAYPDAPGIPTPILLNEHDHRTPYPGDRGIRLEPRANGQESRP